MKIIIICLLVFIIYTKQALFIFESKDSLADWLSAIGTISAVLVALFLPFILDLLKKNQFKLNYFSKENKYLEAKDLNNPIIRFDSEVFLNVILKKNIRVTNCEVNIEYIKKNDKILEENNLGNLFWSNQLNGSFERSFIGNRFLKFIKIEYFILNEKSNQIVLFTENNFINKFNSNDIFEIKVRIYSDFNSTVCFLIKIYFKNHIDLFEESSMKPIEYYYHVEIQEI